MKIQWKLISISIKQVWTTYDWVWWERKKKLQSFAKYYFIALCFFQISVLNNSTTMFPFSINIEWKIISYFNEQDGTILSG